MSAVPSRRTCLGGTAHQIKAGGHMESSSLTLRSVSKIYRKGTNVTALKGVNVTFDPGTLTVLLGRSGSGKSTLLNIAGALDVPSTGSVRMGKDDLDGLKLPQLAKIRAQNVSFVFQEFNLVRTMSVAENAAISMELAGVGTKAARSRATAALERLGVSDLQDRLPDEISGGEQQRVAIARALAARRPIFLADEPTGALDSHNESIVIDIIRELASLGFTCVIATHNTEIAATADRVLHMHDGRLDEESDS